MTLISNTYSWLLKYKIHHLLFWACYHFVFWTTYEGNAFKVLQKLGHPYYAIKFWSFVIFQALGVYFCLYYLIPKYLEQGKYLKYIILAFATTFTMSLVISGGYFLSVNYDDSIPLSFETFKSFFIKHAVPSSLGSMTMGMSIKLAKNWIGAQRRQKELEKEKLETELKFLKSQFNPHFLFNTINSIFVLIHKNQELASESLAKFSDLLRYQLYECNEQQIALGKELSYIKSFIELEKLRQNNYVEIETDLLNVTTQNFAIAPFILMPFIENAFKHISKETSTKNWIHLKTDLVDNKFSFTIKNSFKSNTENSREALSYSGLGLKNVRRRLDLMYLNNYTLNINQKNEVYAVSLTINLNKL